MRHVLYGFIEGFRNCGHLAKILRDSQPNLATHTINPEELKTLGITTLAIDFDGVLAPHGLTEPNSEAFVWLARCCRVFGEDRLFILSNKPAPERIAWFAAFYPKIRFVSGVRKKPYPDGLFKVIEQAGVKPDQVTLLDDRLLTGGLAACLAGTRMTYITLPYVDLKGKPFHEFFFMSIRTIERFLVRLRT